MSPPSLAEGAEVPSEEGQTAYRGVAMPEGSFQSIFIIPRQKYLSIFSYCLKIPPVCAIIKPIKKPET